MKIFIQANPKWWQILSVFQILNRFKKFTNTKIMGFYNYHAVANNLIKSGHCTKAEFKEKHNGVSPAILLHFDNHKPMPIRKESFEKYLSILTFYDVPIISMFDKK